MYASPFAAYSTAGKVPMEPAVLIIGGGTFGVSVAHHLGQKYKDRTRISTVDRAPSPPKPAAAVDINREIRTDYPSALYCDLAYEAIHSWFWSLQVGHHFQKVGWLMLNEADSDVADRINATFKNRGSNCAEEGLLQKLDDRWNGVLKGTDVTGFNDCYLNPEAGWVDAAGVTASFMDAAIKRGVNKVTAEVTSLIFDVQQGRVVGVRFANGQQIAADRFVLAVGAWSSALLSPLEDALHISDQDRLERQAKATGTVSAYYEVSEEEMEHLLKANTPVIVYGGNGEIIPPSEEE